MYEADHEREDCRVGVRGLRTGDDWTGTRSPEKDGGGGTGRWSDPPPGGLSEESDPPFQMMCHSKVPRITGPKATKKLRTWYTQFIGNV